MKVNKAELLAALEKVKPGLASKEIIEQSASFSFMDGRVVTYNDEISVSHPITGLKGITGAIKAQELYQFLGKIDKDEIRLRLKDNQIVLKAGRAQAGFVFQQEIRLPIEEVGEVGEWHDLPSKFIDSLRFCAPICSKDMTRPILTCVNVHSSGTVVASDNYRMAAYSLQDKMPIETFLIPATSAQELIKYNVKQIASGKGWTHFRTEDNTIFSCRVYNDHYPDVHQILEFEGVEVHLPSGLAQALERSQIFAKNELDDTVLVKISLNGNELMVSAQQDFGWFQERLSVEYDGEPLRFMVNPIHLHEILEQMSHCALGQDRIKFEADNWVYVIALTAEED